MKDPRADSAQKLIPPAPLPHVSRQALLRVKSPLPAPTECPYCPGAVELVNNREIYRREFGDWPYAYLCRSCGAYVGLHPNTDIPLGRLADRALREARKTEKSHFERLWRNAASRTAAYQWLAEQLGVPVAQCHWAWFDIDRCRRAGEICRNAQPF